MGRIRGFHVGDGLSLGRELAIATDLEESSSMPRGTPFVCRTLAAIAIIFATTTASAVAAPAASAGGQPNIILIYADDWGWGDLSCHGSAMVRTPNLDRLAAEGTDFQRCYVASPACSPSRIGALTGRHPGRQGVHMPFTAPEGNVRAGQPDWLDPTVPTVAGLLQQAGYRTGHFGKWHLCGEVKTADAPPPSAYGFEESRVFHGPGRRTDPRRVFDEAVEFLGKSRGQPFYMNLWIHQSHVPHMPSAESLATFGHLDERSRVYAAAIADGDRGIGKVLDAVCELGLAEDTLVVFASDNGPEWQGEKPEPPVRGDDGIDRYGFFHNVGASGGLRGRKRSLFEGGIRVPCLVRWPRRVPAGRNDDTTVLSTLDLLPTLCEAAGVAVPAAVSPDGESMLDALEGRAVERSSPLFWEWRDAKPASDWAWPELAVRDGRWKLLMTADGGRTELYDMINDPTERVERAADEPGQVKRLGSLVRTWRDSLPARIDPDCCSRERQAAPTPAVPQP
jgi:arylsulfatase A-like enzyme